MTVDVEVVEQQDPRLGRQKVHDERSRGFAMRLTINRTAWHDKAIRIYDPTPNPDQCHGECTGCAKMMQFNAVGNRKTGVVLGMKDAHINYALNTLNDPFEGTFTFDPATGATGGDDTGSSGLASCKSAQQEGIGGEYRHFFGGADEVIQGVQEGKAISVGTNWYWDMFERDAKGYLHPTGGKAGGHQWIVRGYDLSEDAAIGRCWWNGFRDFKIKRLVLDDLLRDGGDAHWQKRI